MELDVGVHVWVPCEVRSGPFSNERRVRIEIDGNEWFGFVNTQWLRNKAEQGPDEVLVKVVNVKGDAFQAIVPGNAPKPSLFEGQMDRAVAVQ